MMKWALLSALCVGMGAAWLWLFILMHIQGESRWVEPNQWILWTETIGVGAIILFGLYMFVRLLRNHGN